MKRTAKNIKKEFVDRQVESFSGGHIAKVLLNRHKEVLDLVLKYSTPNDFILDVGCFDGKILKKLERVGYKNLYGLDFSEVSRKNFSGSSIRFVASDIEQEEIPFQEKFDVIIFSDVLEHLFSPEMALSSYKRKLASGGKIIFSVPNAGWLLNGPLLSFLPSKLFLSSAFGPWGHTHQFTFYETFLLAQNLNMTPTHLAGGKMDNYAFKSGLKKITYDIFLALGDWLSLFRPAIFSDHIFGVFQNP